VIPLDTHVARQSRRIGLLTRTYNDWKAVEELQTRLEIMNPQDPAKYDFALFGLGALGHELPTSFNLNKVE
jgi:endonuclease III